MKTSTNRWVGLAASLALVVAMGMSVPSIAQAQSQMSVKIPFEFFFGNDRFAAGDYTVLVSGAYIRLSDGNGHTTFLLTNSTTKPERKNLTAGLLVFNRYDNNHFLSEVWRAGYNTGNELIKAPQEIRLARNGTIKEPIVLRAAR